MTRESAIETVFNLWAEKGFEEMSYQNTEGDGFEAELILSVLGDRYAVRASFPEAVVQFGSEDIFKINADMMQHQVIKAVHEALGKRLELTRMIPLITVTVDPANEVPDGTPRAWSQA